MKSILIINNDNLLSKSLKTFLEANNYNVSIAPNLHEADKFILQNKVDVFIYNNSDPKLEMKKPLDGFGRNNFNNSPPMILLSSDGNLKREKSKTFDHLEIPLNYHLLLKKIEQGINNRIKQNFSRSEDGQAFKIASMSDLKDHILNTQERQAICKDDLIYKQHKNASYIYLIAQGLIKTLRMDEYGKELITGIYKDEDLFGFYSFKNISIYPETATAIKDSYIYKFPIKDFQEILHKNNDIALEFAQALSDHVSSLKSNMLDLAYSSVLKKTTKTLLHFAENILKDPSESINLSRSDLASVAGISTESLIRSLAVLKKDNLIEIKGRNIKVIDLKKLHYIK